MTNAGSGGSANALVKIRARLASSSLELFTSVSERIEGSAPKNHGCCTRAARQLDSESSRYMRNIVQDFYIPPRYAGRNIDFGGVGRFKSPGIRIMIRTHCQTMNAPLHPLTTPASSSQTTSPLSALGAYISLAAAMSIVASSIVTGKYITDAMPIFLASAIRFLVATLILAAWSEHLRRSGEIRPHISRRDHAVMALQAFTGIFLFNVLLLLGLKLTMATASGVITSATPAIIALLSGFLGERLTGRIWTGVLLAMAGVLAVNLFGAGGTNSPASNPLLGALLVLGAVAGEALYTIFGKIVSGRLSPVTIATWISLYGTLMFLGPGLWQLRGFKPGDVPASAWMSVAYSAIVVTVVAFVLWFRGLQQVPASTAAPFTGMIPIVAVVLAAILLHEPVGWPHILGIACVIGGILLITSGSARRIRQIEKTSAAT